MPDTDQKQSRQEFATLPAGREPTLRVVPMPSDANYTGDIFGGWIMSQVDIAGAIPAIELAKGRVADYFCIFPSWLKTNVPNSPKISSLPG